MMANVPTYLKGRGRGRGGNLPSQNQNTNNHVQNSTGWARGFNQAADLRGGVKPDSQGSGRGRGAVKKSYNQPEQRDQPSAEERFQYASQQNQESIKRHLQDEDIDKEDNSSDEDDIASDVLEKVFHTYSSTDSTDVDAAQDTLLHSFRSGTSACLVCIETIKKTDPIWSCEGCYAIFHIQCIQKWVKDGVYQQIYKSDDDNVRPEDIPWHCPKCRLEYNQRERPTRYWCYCGKVEDPQFDPWLVPHSCGQTCARKLKPDCGHTCLLLCHPGACPPCPKTLKVQCYCGNAAAQVRRCSTRAWACGGVCGKQLSCKQHTCQQACHPGECAPCPKTSKQECECGKTTAVRPCASPQWKCDKPCNKRLSCGNHLCEIICHRGNCGECPRGGERKCPCEKTTYNLPCTEDIPTCGDTCGKLLECQLHECVQRCHFGPCGSCRQMRVKKCRCEVQKEREVPCYKDYLCETKCNKMRDCGKHPCKRKCCDGQCPPCEQMCNKPLGCKNHKCNSRCHRGRCYPCTETVDIFCFCKATKITVPCGREKVTKPPRCNYPCRRAPDCHHAARIPHRCHFGDCPPCRQICLKPLDKCSHQCPVICHTAVKVRFKDNTRRAGPWEGGPRIIEDVVNRPCPPCMVPLPMQCYGKHEIGQFACSVVQPYQCGRPCGRHLSCGNHTCTKLCHTVEGAEDNDMAGSNCEECELPCQFDRPEGCTHECTQSCHSGPCPPCKQMFRMRCHCQATVQYVECNKWVNSDDQHKNTLKSCNGACPKLLSCGHPCGLTCHAGKCVKPEDCEVKVKVRCKCRRLKRDVKCKDRVKEEGKLLCDDVCKSEMEKKKKKEEEVDREKKLEEEQKQKAELEKYERKMRGKSRKPRKQQEVVEDETFLQKYKTWLILSVSIVVLAVFVYYVMTV
ncbi:NF-X1-type zinc finger protein NFXL1-like [Ruditapes philippinarum]|uniref:NF-X1-type zinc finger protein NFXL1-like n=1 Tax=Ruditapes philippinarum TaxID=129788 RepID=UPI00295B34DC|nr:NF-X1-type zinc finger protein NFXL1-like [Ruditapes philippinarum]